MNPFGVPVVSIALRTAVVYFAILLGLRVSGKREIGQFTPFDLVMILLIANAVQNAMVGPDTSLLGGLIAAAVLLLVNVVVSKASSRSSRVRGLTLGVPRVLVSDGHPVEQNMRREGINQEELEAAVREHGISDLSRVKLAVLEVDGSISVVPEDSTVLSSRPRKHARYTRKHP